MESTCKFKSTWSIATYLTSAFAVVGLPLNLWFFINSYGFNRLSSIIVAVIVFIGCFALIYHAKVRDSYIIENDYLLINIPLSSKKIDLKQISKIEQHAKGSLKGIERAAYHSKGLILYYNQGEKIFITPVEQEKFILILKNKSNHL